ncbi:probable G-protein coupled receptor 148 [Erpetoichthys calabaricus]|uniref:probable G-protein coupled receptor 148 n=1 Tax=Erpetoichthys calabaricus TaxID=27687 RepID=UPI0022347B22|nr:probable G-protein coupled receptor 148 [Erpetoichthys calabaricus]
MPSLSWNMSNLQWAPFVITCDTTPNNSLEDGLRISRKDVNFEDAGLWLPMIRYWRLELFMIPASIFVFVTLLADPLIFICILSSRKLRQETRYLLLANALFADIVFLIFNLVLSASNMAGLHLQKLLCEGLLIVEVTTYCTGILTITLMVLDTYLAVRWPLHYMNLLPSSRAKKIVVGIWILAAVYPVTIMIALEMLDSIEWEEQKVCLMLLTLDSRTLGKEMVIAIHVYFSLGVMLCSLLIFYCYIRLYRITKMSGVWQNRYSRAKMTLLSHTIMLLLYFSPGLVFTIEIFLFQHYPVKLDIRVWMNIININLLVLVPRAFFPYLYGLRYREISDSIRGLFRRRRTSQITSIS